MICPKCSAENPENARLCKSCSWVLKSTATSVENPEAKTSGLAIASLVLAILAPLTVFITALPAVITGIIAAVKIEKSKGQLRGKNLAITGIALPIFLTPFIALALAISMPIMAQMRVAPNRVTCIQNLQGLGKSMLIYANDHDDKYPTPSQWCDLLIEHTDANETILQCRGDREGPSSYAMNKNIETLGVIAPPDMVLLFETKPGWNQSGGPELISTENHCGEGCFILFNNSHIQFFRTEDFNKLQWTADQDNQKQQTH